jgi:hypothetical protein
MKLEMPIKCQVMKQDLIRPPYGLDSVVAACKLSGTQFF